MGSEVVFEMYKQNGDAPVSPEPQVEGTNGSGFFVRVLFGGQPLKSSNPSLGLLDMVPAETLLAYFNGLVGTDASLVVGKCNGTISV